MLCPKCGAQLRGGAKFCARCGSPIAGDSEALPAADAAPARSPTLSGPSSGSGLFSGGGRRPARLPIIIGAAAAAVVVLAVVLIVSGAFGGARSKVGAALLKSYDEFSALYEKTGLPDPAKMAELREFSQELSLTLEDIGASLIPFFDASQLEGLGIRFSSQGSIPDRELSASADVYWDGASLIGAAVSARDSILSVSSPELTNGEYYGVDTLTLGEDLYDLGADLGGTDPSDMSFDIFELMDSMLSSGESAGELEKLIRDAALELAGAAEVGKAGRRTADINGHSAKCSVYDIFIPQEALEDFLDVCLDVLGDIDPVGLLEELYAALGLPGELLDETLAELGAADYMSRVEAAAETVLDVLGDVELELYISGGYVSAILYDDNGVELGVYLGGGSVYVDDISVTITAGSGAEIEFESTGDHTGKNGAITDETTVKTKAGGVSATVFKSELSYDVKADEDNFRWDVRVAEEGSVSVEGRLTGGKDSLSLEIDELTVSAQGFEAVTFSAGYSIGPCSEVEGVADSPSLISDMDEDELRELGEDIAANARNWLADVLGKLPGGIQSSIIGLIF